MNKVWLVTGSASGLGRNIAEAVLESGDRLAATARDTKRLDDLVKKYGDRVRAVPLDVTDESAAQAAVQTAVAAFGRLDVVVNNAGYGDIAPFEQLSAARFKAVMDTNFYGVVNVTRAAVPLMREQRSGCILQLSGWFRIRKSTESLLYARQGGSREFNQARYAVVFGNGGSRRMYHEPQADYTLDSAGYRAVGSIHKRIPGFDSH